MGMTIAKNITMIEKGEKDKVNNNKKATSKRKRQELTSSSSKCSASIIDTLSFLFGCGDVRVVGLFFFGVVVALGNGLVYPAIAYIFSKAFSDISAATVEGDHALEKITEVAYAFLIIGVYALVLSICQTMSFEIVAYHASQNFKRQWFTALLRQDSAYYDVYNINGIANTIGPSAFKYRKGIGRKLGEGLQFLSSGLGGIAFAFYMNWKVALCIYAATPFVSGFCMLALHLTQTKKARAAKAYELAGSIAYTTVSDIRTVLSLNATNKMIQQYAEATREAFSVCSRTMAKLGFAYGGLIGSMMLLYAVLTLYGSYLLYSEVQEDGCDPSHGVEQNTPCKNNGAGVLGAMLGIMFGAQALSQITNVLELFTAARVATFQALQVINRIPDETPEQTIYYDSIDDNDNNDNNHQTTNAIPIQNNEQNLQEEGHAVTQKPDNHNQNSSVRSVRAILPPYEINALSREGVHGEHIIGKIHFQNVHFHYPTRPYNPILTGFSLEIQPGQTIALVGPSGGGKSTIVSLLERFYDPTSGSIVLDDTINIKDMNVSYWRSIIGYVGQEPALFSTSIRQNILYGNPDATQYDIEEAAKLANAHDFITSFPNGYDTQVGYKGSQLSGGQKQRIAIARVLVGKPKILLLDEATSALDSESELVVQRALDNVLDVQMNSKNKVTTIVIAHRLSTIRNADMIAMVVNGQIVETGTHSELMDSSADGFYRNLVEKQSIGGLLIDNKKQQKTTKGIQKSNGTNETVTTMTGTSTTTECGLALSPLSARTSFTTTDTILNSSNDDVDSEDVSISDNDENVFSELVVAHQDNVMAKNYDAVVVQDFNIDDNSPMTSTSTPHIRFQDVTFAYPSRPEKLVFDSFNLDIQRGETIALVGPSGGGKSTTVGLIERFYDPVNGTVEYDGHDIRSLNVQWYRDQLGYVSQEPTLFNDTIGANIAYGAPGVSQSLIEDAARQANAHDFIKSFKDGYNTKVGERGSQLSGGQKQRVAIARALVKKPKILLLDEATSALDNESEAIVQAALHQVMQSREHTTIVIAHRLSTIWNVDRIAFIADGEVVEFGHRDELLAIPNGRFKRLFETQKYGGKAADSDMAAETELGVIGEGPEDDDTSIKSRSIADNDDEGNGDVNDEENTIFARRAKKMAMPDIGYYILGSLGAIGVGVIYPVWGILVSDVLVLLFQRVYLCEDYFFLGNTINEEWLETAREQLALNGFSAGEIDYFSSLLEQYDNCDDYWSQTAEDMKQQSFELAIYWGIIMAICWLAYILLLHGFGTASERLNKRVRDATFSALVRQEPGFFDKRTVGSIMTELQDDAARIHAFSGDPIRASLIAISSGFTGVLISFIFMWPFAIVALICLPLMCVAASFEMQRVMMEDDSDGGDNDKVDITTPGGIAVETLLNMKSVWALSIEGEILELYNDALQNEERNYVYDSFNAGFKSGLSQFVNQWVNALQVWWGGYLLVHYPDHFDFRDFLYSNMGLLFSIFGLGVAFQDLADRKEVVKSAKRIFYLLDRESEIDPLSEKGVMMLD